MGEHRSSSEWLKVHGLGATGLSLTQILCSLGFQQRSGEVQSLGRPVASQYGTGLFLQHPDQAGHVYNLVDADEKKLQGFEERLITTTAALKQRLKWLNSGSRKMCGVVCERKVLLVLLRGVEGRRAGLSPAVRAVLSLLKDQGTYLTHFNIISGSCTWKQQLTVVKEEVFTEARQWLLDTKLNFTHSAASNLIEALNDEQLEAVYLIVEGGQKTEELRELAGKVQHSSIPVHVVVLDCKSPALLETCQYFASACGGRCHADGGKGGFLCLPRPDVLDVWGELELARDTLAQVQALHMEVAERNRTYSDNVTEACSRKSLCTEVEACASPGTSRHAPSISKAVASLSMAKQDKREVLSVSISPPQSNTQSVVKKTRKTVKRHCQVRSKSRASPDTTALPPVTRQQSAHRGGHPNASRARAVHTGSIFRGSSVLACCKQDGFYYKGSIVGSVSTQSAVVRFCDSSCQTTLLTKLIPIGGAAPRPLLRGGDHVLCCVRQRQGRRCSKYGICDFYIPAQVQVVPKESSRGCALFCVTTFCGEQVSCTRSGLEKITESRYRTTCSQIVQCKQQNSNHTQSEANTQQEDGNTPVYNDQRAELEDSQTPPDSSQLYLDDVTACQEREDRGTITESPDTVERGTIVHVPTQEQAVGTGPLMVDHSTTTLCTTAEEGLDTTDYEQGVDIANSENENDSPVIDLTGQQVFCCWPENGWYYRACVLGRGNTGSSWIVRTESGEVDDIPAANIIINSKSNPILVGATVLGSHPLLPGSFAPGNVINVDSRDFSCCVLFYDGLQAQSSLDEIQLIPLAQHEEAVRLLQERDRLWVGLAVVARRDSDGVYYPAVVMEKLDGQSYELQWADGSYQKQGILHMFGLLTTRRSLHAGDHVLALAMPGLGACLPSTVTGTEYPKEKGGVEVKFSDGERQMVSKEQCFWISPAYFLSAVQYISTAFSQSHLPSTDINNTL